LVLQAAVGYAQYFTHLPAALVEVHVLGATVLVVGMTQFLLAMTDHPMEADVPTRTPSTDDARTGGAPRVQVGG
jgi:cytochrome c oxidase assembly protein subunit 15